MWIVRLALNRPYTFVVLAILILMISAMLGAINLSRAVSDPKLSREILQQARDQLISLNKPAKTS